METLLNFELLIFRLTPPYMLMMMVYIALLLIFRLTPPYMLMMMVYIVTVTYFQVDSTVYVNDDGLYCHCYLFSG